MHYSNLVIVKREEPFDLDAAVEGAMGPKKRFVLEPHPVGGRYLAIVVDNHE